MANTTIGKNRTIQQNQLVPGTFVSIRGRTEYSRLLTPIDGEELAKDKIRKQQSGMQPIDKPYTTIQITDARVLPRDPSGVMSNEELYVDQRMYQRIADGPNGPWRFTCTNRNTSIPNQFFMARPGSPMEADQIIPEHELANGLDVILVLRIFESSTFGRKGLGLHAIILQEPIRYYSGNNDKALAEAGIILHTNPAMQQAQAQSQAPASSAAAAQPAPQVSAPAPGTGYSSDTAQRAWPQQQAAPQQPAQQAQPTKQEWICSTCGNHVPMGMAFCGSCGTHRPDNPYAGQAQQATGGAQPGINFDPNQRDY